MALDIAGVDFPKLVPADESGLHDEEMVIGVQAYGKSHAYLRSALSASPYRHIVNDVVNAIPITVIHCDRTQCTRVFTSGKPDESIEVRCGGWLPTQELALLIGERRYAQSAADIPLIDLPFVVTTWKEWRTGYPDSMVYLGDTSPQEEKMQQSTPVLPN